MCSPLMWERYFWRRSWAWLDLKGKDLHVNRLNLEKGEADIEGEIDMITYSKVPEVTGKKDKMFGRIFR